MQNLRLAHQSSISADLAILESSPRTVTTDQLRSMGIHLANYERDVGKSDFWRVLAFVLLECLTFLGVLTALVSPLAMVPLALLGRMPWTYLLIPTVLGLVCIKVKPYVTARLLKVSTGRVAASTLRAQLKPWSKYNRRRAEALRTLSDEAETYFLVVTTDRTPLEFQLTALHRMTNTLTLEDELDIELYNNEKVIVGDYIHEHPNWRGPASDWDAR